MATWTAEDWDRSDRVWDMLQALQSKTAAVSDRRLRLFCVTLCNRFRKSVKNARCIAALAAAERDIDTPLLASEREALRQAVMQWVLENRRSGQVPSLELAASEACGCALGYGLDKAVRTSNAITEAYWHQTQYGTTSPEQAFQADLLRHIVGNPFRPCPTPPALHAAVVQLAAALEAGELVAFALRDALLEAGQMELAEHFGGDEPHPRGCWALDLLLGKA